MAAPSGELTKEKYTLKSLGVYLNFEELEHLFDQLTSVINQEGLINNTPVFVRLAGNDIPVRLITEVRPIDEIFPEAQETSLFFIDVVSLMTGIARILNATGKTDQLPEFNQEIADDYLLRLWHQEQRSGLLTKESQLQLQNFIGRVQNAINQILEVGVGDLPSARASKESSSATSSNIDINAVTTKINSGTTSANADDSGGANANEPVDLNDVQVRERFNTEVNWIYAFAKEQLLTKHLDGLGTTFDSLSPELQDQFIELAMLLRDQIANLVEHLPPEQLSALLNNVGNLQYRTAIFLQLINTLLSDPTLPFFAKLQTFYKEYFLHLSKTSPNIDIEQTIDTFTLIAIKESTENEALKRISASIQAWKRELITKFKAEREAEMQQEAPIEDEIESADEVVIIPAPQEDTRTDDIPVTALQKVRTEVERSNFSTDNKDILRDQAPRLLWGTAAELFQDDQGSLANIDQALFDQVSSHALEYILGLESSELAKLQKSPSALIRHIKNLRDRVLRDQNFTIAYEKYKANHDVPVISRANRVEKETDWASSQIEFELFASHNINDDTTPDENGLQRTFDGLKNYIDEKIFVYFDNLSDEALEQLYIKPAQRAITLRQLHNYLNEDVRFMDVLGQFYNKFLGFYNTPQQQAFQNQVRGSLQRTHLTDGVHYQLIETQEINTQKLFSQTVLTTLKEDNQVLSNAVSVTLDSLILSYGLTETQALINNINPKLLEITFGLQAGTLKPENLDQFRSLLSQFSIARHAKFEALTGSEQAQGIYGGLQADQAKQVYSSMNATNFSSRMEPVRAVREVVQKNSGEEVAEAVDKKSMKEKAQSFFKLYQQSWENLEQRGQIVVYLYYGKTVGQQYIQKTADAKENLPLPIEFLDFEQKNRDGKLLEALLIEYRDHGVDDFNPLLTHEFSKEADSVADHYERVEQLRTSLTLHYLEELDEIQQQKIAVAQGYATAAILMQELERQAGYTSDGNVMSVQQAAALPAIGAILASQEYELSSNEGITSAAMLDQTMKAAEKGRRPSPAQALMGAFKKTAQKKVGKALAKKTLGTVAKGVLGAATGGVVTVGAAILSNKKLREYAMYGLTSFVANTLYAFSTIGGLALGTLGGIAGGVLWGPAGALGGGLVGTYAGANIWPQQWGSWMGFTPRQAPGFESWLGNTGIDSTSSSMAATKAANAAAAQAATSATSGQAAAQAAQSTAAANTATANAATTSAGSTTGGLGGTTAGTTAAAAATPALQGLWSYLTSLSIGVSAPLLAMGVVILATTYVIMVIAGAFLVPVPTRNSNWKGRGENTPIQESAKFVDVKKTADITQIENNTPTEITYTITVTPQANYSILITDVSDTFSGYGATQNAAGIISLLGVNSFPGEAFNSPYETSYTVSVGDGTVDSVVTNTLIISFDAINLNGYVENGAATYRTSASVRVGDPKEGCWPARGYIYQLPYGSFSHSSVDAYDIPNVIGTPIYAPFAGKLIRQPDGPLTPSLNPADFGPEPGRSSYGRWVTLETTIDGKAVYFIFGHLDETIVGQGEFKQVQAQEVIGYMGHNGFSSGSHLHYELRAGSSGLKLQDLVPQRAGGGYPRVNDPTEPCI